MIRKPRRMMGMWLAGLAGAALWAGGAAPAQDVDIKAIQERLDRLEKQNEELRARLTATPVRTEEGTPPGGEMKPGTDAKSVEKIVGDFLKKQEADKKKADAAKSKEFAEVGSDLNMKVKWNNGISFETPLKDFKFHVGGRVQADWAWFAPDEDLESRGWNDGASFRRFRFRADGTAWEVVKWNAEIDYSDTTPTVTDTYMEITQLPVVGNFRAGHFHEPFTLENWGVSDNWITFMERATVIDALAPARNMGMIFHNTAFKDRMFWGAGIFRPNSAGGGFTEDAGDGEYAYTGRLTFNPFYSEDGRCWLHFGGGYSYRSTLQNPSGTIGNASGEDPRFRTRIPLRTRGTTFVNSERVIDTGNLLADHIQLFNFQGAFAWGPFSMQGEIITAQVSDLVRGPTFRDPAFWGCYVYASYFLTGEHRPYQRKLGGIGMPVVHEPFFLVKGEDGKKFGRGAWELIARYGFVDLGSPAIDRIGALGRTSDFQGHLQDVTLGVNWYLNNNFRIMGNYVYAHVNGLDVSPTTQSGDVHAFGMRFSWFF